MVLQLLHLSQHLFDIDFRFCLHLRYGQRQPCYGGLLEQDAQRQLHLEVPLSRETTRVASKRVSPKLEEVVVMPTRSSPNTSSQISTSCSSAGVRGSA